MSRQWKQALRKIQGKYTPLKWAQIFKIEHCEHGIFSLFCAVCINKLGLK